MASQTLEPTSDPTENADRLQRALDKLRAPAWRFNAGQLVLRGGEFAVDRPLTAGAPDSLPVSIRAEHYAAIKYVGPRTTERLITFRGSGRSRVPVLQGVVVNPMRKARGVLFHKLQHTELMRDAIVLFPRQVGAELSRCWGASVRNSEIVSGVGVGLLTHEFNTARMDQLRVLTYGCHHRSWDSEKCLALWQHEVALGRESAKAKFGSDYVEDWPAELPAADRACMVLRGGNQIIDALNLEHARPCEYPLINWRTSASSLRGMRVESTSTRHEKIVLSGSRAVTIGWVEGGCHDHSSAHCLSFAKLRACRDVVVHDSVLQGLSTGVMRGGSPRDAAAVRVTTINNVVPDHVPARA